MSDLRSYVKSNSKFLAIQDGETVSLIYKGFEIVDDRFNAGKKTVSYLFQDVETGKILPWNKSSNKVALQMDKVSAGQTINITRLGEGMGTTYRIKVVEDRKPLGNVNPDEAPF